MLAKIKFHHRADETKKNMTIKINYTGSKVLGTVLTLTLADSSPIMQFMCKFPQIFAFSCKNFANVCILF